ncbi:MAG: peptidoglycan DD-metalloendopeptidase family protein [Magnetococcales bacterium]|nr:peptidoglycan DD-metalloendopeptidase family protein [Magnetococcales bacterium]
MLFSSPGLLRGTLTAFLIVTFCGGASASTGVSGTPDYLQHMLKKELKEDDRSKAASSLTDPTIDGRGSMSQLPSAPVRLASLVPMQTVVEPQRTASRTRVVIERIRRDDTYADLMQRQNIPRRTAKLFALKAKPLFDLSQRLKTDTPVKLTFNANNQLIGFGFPIDRDVTLRITADEQERITASLEKNRPAPPPQPTLSEERKDEPKKENATTAANEESRPAANDERNNGNDIIVEDETISDDEEEDSNAASIPDSLSREFAGLAITTREVTIRPGDSLGALLSRRHIPNLTALQLSKAARPVYDLAKQLAPGKTVTLSFAPNGNLVGMMYPVDRERTFWITSRDGKNFAAKFEKKMLDVRLESIDGTIRNERSLFVAANRAGLSRNLAIKLAGLFEWDIDFARDLHPGDRFTILQEGLFYKGKRVRDGDIVAAEFTNQGQLFRAVRYIDPSGHVGYYDKDGNNVRKMFIRAPMDYTRVSSHFSSNRLHPVFGFNRAHKGVDYAAPQGTPVRAAGEGVVDFIGNQGGFGNMIIVRHSPKFSTAYAHLSAFASGLRQGERVRQGEVIGRVGATGTATGPHLHYEVRVNGEQVNPFTVQLPSSGPVEKKFLADFRNQSNQLMALLKKRKTGDVTHLASLSLTQRAQSR